MEKDNVVEQEKDILNQEEVVEEDVKEVDLQKEEVKEEQVVKKKNKKGRNIILLIIDAIILLIVAYFVVGYFNFFKISQGDEPVMKAETNHYEYGIGNVTVHDYKIYKIVKYEIPNRNVTYSMKLWFMDDVK